MSDDRRRVRMGVSYNLIEHALKLPDGVRIERIEHNPDGWREGFFVLSGPDFPDAIPGNDLIRVTPTITIVPESHAWDWGLPPSPAPGGYFMAGDVDPEIAQRLFGSPAVGDGKEEG